MPELPEVARAAGVARRATRGRVIASVDVLHPAPRRDLPRRQARSLAGDHVVAVRRRAKYQVLALASGRSLVVHFRMTGDWERLRPGAPVPVHTRILLRFTDGSALACVDPRALGRITLVPAGEEALPSLGPDATSRALTAATLARRGGRGSRPIKLVLLDQGVVAGVGNIYASEALWLARIDPRTPARDLGPPEWRRLVRAVKHVMRKALAQPARYYQSGASRLRFNVYDREGRPCRRCRAPIRRLTQGGRSTYFCAACQPPSPSPR